MKNFIFIFLLFPVISFSQEVGRKTNFGLRISPGMTFVSKDIKYTSLGYEAYQGGSLQVGFRYHKPYSKIFGFGSEILVQAKSVGFRKRNRNVTTTCITGTCDKDDQAYFEHNYNSTTIDFNLYGTVHSGWGYASPYILLGINSSFLLSGKYKYNDWTSSRLVAKETWTTGNAQFDDLSIGLVTGLGTKAVFFNLESMFEVRYLFYPNDQVEGINSKISIINFGWTMYFNRRR